ncbi:MAG: hypothetical protein ACOYXU_06950 [Nitrospirota bacterium]
MNGNKFREHVLSRSHSRVSHLHVRLTITCAAIALLAFGCGGLWRQAPPGTITASDARMVLPFADRYYYKEHRLSANESQSINERLGRPITSPGEVITYYRVSRNPRRPIGETGNVFVERVESPQGPLRVIIAVRGGVVRHSVVQGGAGSPVVSHEFLDQFVDRDLGHSFEVATDPEAFHRIPVPIAPIAGQVELSQRIADAVRKTLVIAQEIER